MERNKKKGNSKQQAKGTNKPGQATRLPNSAGNKTPLRARQAASGLDTWRARGGAPASRSQRKAQQAPAKPAPKKAAAPAPKAAAPANSQAAQQAAAVRRAQRQGTINKLAGRSIVGGTVATALLSAPEEIRKGVRLVQGKAGGDFKDSLNDMGINILGKGPRNRPKAGDAQTRFPNARRNAEIRTERIKAGIPEPKTANQGQATRQAEQRRSVGATTATPAPRQSPARPSQAQPRSASGTAGTGRKWEDFNPGRGTSETNNPLMKNDSWLMSKIKEREDKQAKNVGPVADGSEYSASKKSAEIVQRRKKKEEDDKKKQQP